MQNRIIVALAIVAAEVSLVLVSILLGFALNQNFTIWPSFLPPFAPAPWFFSDWITTIQYFSICCGLVFFAGQMIFGSDLFGSARRFAIELYILVVAFTLSALSLFLFSLTNFSPSFMLAAALVMGAVFLSLGVAGLVLAQRDGRPVTALSALGDIIIEALGQFTRLRTAPFATFVVIFAAVPVALAFSFKQSEFVRDRVTHLRLMMNANDDYAYEPMRAWAGVTFLQPMQVGFSPVDPNIAFVLERRGRLYRLDRRDPAATKTLIINIEDRVKETRIEAGALGFSLHPMFTGDEEGNPFVYIMYTEFIEGVEQTNRISKFDLLRPTVETRSTSEIVLIETDREPIGFHNGGTLKFGPDGFLYIGIGDATNLPALQRIDYGFKGTFIRIDVDQLGGAISHAPPRQPENGRTAHYMIPKDNPFVGVPNAMEEIYAIGFRNPFRFSFDPIDGQIWAGDVGAAEWEEVNLVISGGNYQFPYMEGYEPWGIDRPAEVLGKEVPPILTYIHTAYERAIIGGPVYRDNRLATLQDRYIFADNYSGHIYAMPATGEPSESAEIVGRAQQFAQRGVSSLETTPEGDILITTLGDPGVPTGEVLRLVPSDQAEAYQRALDLGPQVPTISADLLIDAKDLYSNYCARCHADSGNGDKEEMQGIEGVEMPNFTLPEYHERRDAAYIRKIIVNGGGVDDVSPLMPPWGDLLSEEEVDALVDYVQAFEGTGG